MLPSNFRKALQFIEVKSEREFLSKRLRECEDAQLVA